MTAAHSLRFGKPLGETLTGLFALGPKLQPETGGDALLGLLRPSDARCATARRELEVEILGSCFCGTAWFGVPLKWDARTVDDSPVVLIDDTELKGEVVAANLADFLSLIALAPDSWGANRPADWKAVAEAAQARWPVEAKRLRAVLCTLPGVRVPAEPAALQKTLPRLGTLGGDDDVSEVEQAVREVFSMCASRAKLELLFLIDAVVERGSKVGVHLQLDVPAALEEELSAEPLVTDPVKKFIKEIRARFPEHRFEVSWVEADADEEGDDDRWRRLELSLDRAGARALFTRLKQAHARR